MVSFKLVDLARLQGQLNIANVRKNDEPLYQVVSQLIGAVKQVQNTVNFNISTFSQGLVVSAGTSSGQVLTLAFSNQNSVSFGLSGSTITGSANPGILFSASGSSGRFTGLTFSNSNNVTFGNSNGVITATVTVASTAGSVRFSAGTASNNLSSVVFSNSNGVSFGLNGSTITASISVTANGNITFSAGTSTVASNSFIFSNSNGVSFGLNGITVTGSVAAAANASINISAGTTSNDLTNLVFSNSNGVSFGLNGSTVTATINAAGANTLSYFENAPLFGFTAATAAVATNNLSQMFIQPFLLPFNLSGSYLRNLITQSFQNNISFGATSANTTFSATQFFTHAIVLYTLDTGANSNSLVSIFSTSLGRTHQSIIGNGTAGTQFTITYNVTYNALGSTGLTFSTTTNFSNGSYIYTTGPLSRFHGPMLFDFPFATSLSAGQYWLGNAMSVTSSNNGPSGAFSGGSAGYSSIMMNQLSIQPKIMGATNQSDQLQPGLGSFTTNSAFISTSGFNLSDIGARPNNNLNFIQIIRRA